MARHIGHTKDCDNPKYRGNCAVGLSDSIAIVSCKKPSNITIEEDLIWNSIYRICLKNGDSHEVARGKGYKGINYSRENPGTAAIVVVNTIITQ